MESKWLHHISFAKYIFPFFGKRTALHQNVANCQNTLTVLTLRWGIFAQDIWIGQMWITDAGTTQDYYILPALNHYRVHEANPRQTWQQSLPFHCPLCQYGWVPIKNNVFIGKLYKDTLSYHHPKTLCSSWHESKSVKIVIIHLFCYLFHFWQTDTVRC